MGIAMKLVPYKDLRITYKGKYLVTGTVKQKRYITVESAGLHLPMMAGNIINVGSQANSFDLRVREKEGGKKRKVCQVDGPEEENILLRKITRQDIFCAPGGARF